MPVGMYAATMDTNNPGVTDIVASFGVPLAPGKDLSMTITATAMALGLATNQAAVEDALIDVNPMNNAAQVVTDVQSPEMAIGMTGAPDFMAVGDSVVYTINVTNFGPVRADGVTITNTLPANLSFTMAATPLGTYTNIGADVIFQLGSLATGRTATLTVAATAISLGLATNMAIETNSQVDPNLLNNTAIQVVAARGLVAFDLAIGMIRLALHPKPRRSDSWWFILCRFPTFGPVRADGVVITDTLPANLSFTTASNPGGTYTNLQNAVVFELGSMTNGQTATMTITAAATGLGMATNVAVVAGTQTDTNMANNTAATAISVVAPDLGMGMTVSPASLSVGQLVTYRLSISNLGPEWTRRE